MFYDRTEAESLQRLLDGTFEIMIGGKERPGNWLRLAPGEGTTIDQQLAGYRERFAIPRE